MSRTLYNCRTSHNGWMFAKFDPDFNVAAIYTIKAEGNPAKMSCDCPGWPRKSTCKHTRMVNIFALAGAIDTSQFYCYETQTWHQPIQTHDENDPTAEKATRVFNSEALPPIRVRDFIAPPPPPSPTPPKLFRRV